MPCCGAAAAAYLPSEAVTQAYGRWQPPDEDKAFTRHRAEHVHHDFFDLCTTRVHDFKEFGVGHMMYFTFLWWMAALFGALAVLVAAPNISINLAGKYFEGGQLELTTLGNFGRVSVAHSRDGPSSYTPTGSGWAHENSIAQAFMSDAALPPAASPMHKGAAVVAASAIDCAGAGLFFLATLGLILLARRRAEQADVHTVTIHDYSVYVRRLPGDAAPEELTEFFAQFGDVEEVEVVRAYGSLLRLVLARGTLMLRLRTALAALRKAAQEMPQVPLAMEAACHSAKDDVEEVEFQIQMEEAQGDARRVVGAFVTFGDERSKLACLQATPRSWIRQMWSLEAQHRFRGRHALLVEEAPEPSDIKYENMEHGALDRAARATLVAVCSYAALAVGFLLISLATAAQVNLARAAGVDTTQCDRSCRLSVDGALGMTAADRELYASCADTGRALDGAECASADRACYRCFCFSALTAGMISESSYCGSALELLALQYSGQAGVVLAILGINMVLALTSRRLTLFEKHHTRSAEARSLAQKLFLAQFLNSALSTIVANAHLPFLANLFNGSVLEGIFFQGIYTDLTPNWYKVVGRSLLISQCVAAVLRLVYLLLRRLTVWYNLWRRHTCLTQEDLEATLRGPEFELDYRYGEHLSVIYVTLLLSGGMPFAYVSAAVWFAAAYWADKYELLALSRRPVIYGADLSNHVMGLLPYAAVWHLALSLWAFSLFGVSQSRLVSPPLAWLVSTVCAGMSSVWEHASGITTQQAEQRLLGAGAVHLLVMLFVLAAVLFLRLTLTLWLAAGRWLLTMAGLLADDEDTQDTGVPEFGAAVRTQLLVGQASYAIQDQPAYAAAFKAKGEEEVQLAAATWGADAHVQVALQGALHKGGDSGSDPGGSARALGAASSPRAQSLLAVDAAPGGEACHDHQHSAAAPGVHGAGPPGASDSAAACLPASAAAGVRSSQLTRLLSTRSTVSRSSSGSSRTSSRSSRHSSDAHAAAHAGAYPAMPPLGERQPGTPSASLEGGGGPRNAGSASMPQGAPVELSAAQRFRQARANQVVPIPEEYLAQRGGDWAAGDA